MKKTVLLFVLILFSIITFAQQFSFNLYVEDALGNRDSLVLGYDPLATDSIDAAFGEVDIKSNPWDSVFEARVSKESYLYGIPTYMPAHESKVQILEHDPQSPYSPMGPQFTSSVYIAVKNMHPPFYLSWDSILFQDSSIMSSGFWFLHLIDGGIFKTFETDSFCSQNSFSSIESYYMSANDTIWLLGFTFSSFNTLGVDHTSKGTASLSAYPNPCEDVISFDFANVNSISDLLIYNSLGQLIRQESISKIQDKVQVNISEMKSGIYYYQVIEKDKGFLYSGKFIKK